MKNQTSFRAGFSLIEVSAALCIISVALTSLMALIPMGLANTRATKSETRAAEVAHTIFNTLAVEPFKRAQCFSTAEEPLNLSTLGKDDPSTPTILYATFDILRDFAQQPLTIMRSPKRPDVMATDTEVYRIELRNYPEPFSDLDTTPVGSVVRIAVFLGNEKKAAFRGSSFVGSYGKAGVLQTTAMQNSQP